MDSGDCALLLLLVLTAAFDTMEHDILITQLDMCVGTTEDSTSQTRASGFLSSPTAWEVQQGSLLCLLLLTIYLLPHDAIFLKDDLSFHFYADDYQIHFPLKCNGAPFVQSLLMPH